MKNTAPKLTQIIQRIVEGGNIKPIMAPTRQIMSKRKKKGDNIHNFDFPVTLTNGSSTP